MIHHIFYVIAFTFFFLLTILSTFIHQYKKYILDNSDVEPSGGGLNKKQLLNLKNTTEDETLIIAIKKYKLFSKLAAWMYFSFPALIIIQFYVNS